MVLCAKVSRRENSSQPRRPDPHYEHRHPKVPRIYVVQHTSLMSCLCNAVAVHTHNNACVNCSAGPAGASTWPAGAVCALPRARFPNAPAGFGQRLRFWPIIELSMRRALCFTYAQAALLHVHMRFRVPTGQTQKANNGRHPGTFASGAPMGTEHPATKALPEIPWQMQPARRQNAPHGAIDINNEIENRHVAMSWSVGSL